MLEKPICEPDREVLQPTLFTLPATAAAATGDSRSGIPAAVGVGASVVETSRVVESTSILVHQWVRALGLVVPHLLAVGAFDAGDYVPVSQALCVGKRIDLLSRGFGHSLLIWPNSSQLRHWKLAILRGSVQSFAMWPSWPQLRQPLPPPPPCGQSFEK